MKVSQNGPGTLLVSWTPPQSGEPTVKGYIIYCNDGSERHSHNAGASATTVSITGLLKETSYSITVVATSDSACSIETTAVLITIHEGIVYYAQTNYLSGR